MTAAQCLLLASEFGNKALMAGQGTPLENAFGDIVSLVTSVLDRAYLSVLTGAAKDKAEQEALQLLSTQAAVTQVGGSSSAGGSTSLVTKPTTTDFLSMAAESGAFTDTQNGNAVTLQANANGLLKYLSNRPAFLRWRSKYASALQPLSFAVSMNVAQSGSTSVPTTGSASSTVLGQIGSIIIPSNNASFSSFSASYSIYRPYNPQDPQFEISWNAALDAQKSALTNAGQENATVITSLLMPILSSLPSTLSAAQALWIKNGKQAEQAGDFDQLVVSYANYYTAYQSYLVSTSQIAAQVLAVNNAINAYQSVAQSALDSARGHPLATVSYTYSTPVQQPSVHQGTAEIAYLFKGKASSSSFLTGAQLTGNFTASIYSSLPTGAQYGRLRDLQFDAEFDKPFGGTKQAPRGTVSFAGYGQYQYDPTVLSITEGNLAPGTNIQLPGSAQVLLGTAGWLEVVQGKVVINLNKGLTIPLAIKWSNKTDLLQGNDVRGQFGLSYDLSALSSLIK
jgi:hypothetical protein